MIVPGDTIAANSEKTRHNQDSASINLPVLSCKTDATTDFPEVFGFFRLDMLKLSGFFSVFYGDDQVALCKRATGRGVRVRPTNWIVGREVFKTLVYRQLEVTRPPPAKGCGQRPTFRSPCCKSGCRVAPSRGGFKPGNCPVDVESSRVLTEILPLPHGISTHNSITRIR